MTRLRRGNPARAQVYDGALARTGDEPVRPRRPSRSVPDPEAVAAAVADLDARAELLAVDRHSVAALGSRVGSYLSPTGVCHDCGRKVSGERRFCGRCLSTHRL